MKTIFKLALQWYDALEKKSLLSLILIFMAVLLLVILPIVGSVLPFTYLAL